MGTQNEVDESETAWYVQGYYSKLGGGKRNYKVATRNKQEAAFIPIIRIKTALYFRFSLGIVLISYPHLRLLNFH